MNDKYNKIPPIARNAQRTSMYGNHYGTSTRDLNANPQSRDDARRKQQEELDKNLAIKKAKKKEEIKAKLEKIKQEYVV